MPAARRRPDGVEGDGDLVIAPALPLTAPPITIGDLAACSVRESLGELGGGADDDLLVELRQLSTHGDRDVAASTAARLASEVAETLRRFERDRGMRPET